MNQIKASIGNSPDKNYTALKNTFANIMTKFPISDISSVKVLSTLLIGLGKSATQVSVESTVTYLSNFIRLYMN